MTTASSKKHRILTKEQQINLASDLLCRGQLRCVGSNASTRLWAKVVKLLASQPKRVRDVREKLDTQNARAPRIRFVLLTRVGLELHFNLTQLGLSKRLCKHLKYLAMSG